MRRGVQSAQIAEEARMDARTLRVTLSACIAAWLAACSATPPRADDKPVAEAVAPVAQTPATDYVAVEEGTHPAGESGFRLLTKPSNALMSRLALADQAAQAIDLQSFIFNDDATGRLVAHHLLDAADRGVRVRLLVDAMDSRDPDLFDALDAHRNIEVRLFNPFGSRDPGKLATLGQMLMEFQRLNRRMHNKSFIVDNRIAIVGGRNIGDEYFDADGDSNFRDLDLLAIGPVVRNASNAFDTYWNDETAVPANAFGSKYDGPQGLATLRARLDKNERRFERSDYAQAVVAELPHGATEVRPGDWFWGPAELVADAPGKVEARGDQPALRIGPRLQQVLEAAQSEVLITSPYFVPGESELAQLAGLVKHGAHVSVLTNSLASTDHATVHAAYSQRRHALLDGGVRLFELRPRPEQAPSAAAATSGGDVALHAKSFVVDRRYVFVGSLNLDPRSKLLNTEMGVIVDNPALAAAIADYFASATAPANAYEVVRDKDSGHLRWVTEDDGRRVELTHEPDAGLRARIKVLLGKLLPIDNLM
jgi:putative cardiolipin synthase